MGSSITTTSLVLGDTTSHVVSGTSMFFRRPSDKDAFSTRTFLIGPYAAQEPLVVVDCTACDDYTRIAVPLPGLTGVLETLSETSSDSLRVEFVATTSDSGAESEVTFVSVMWRAASGYLDHAVVLARNIPVTDAVTQVVLVADDVARLKGFQPSELVLVLQLAARSAPLALSRIYVTLGPDVPAGIQVWSSTTLVDEDAICMLANTTAQTTPAAETHVTDFAVTHGAAVDIETVLSLSGRDTCEILLPLGTLRNAFESDVLAVTVVLSQEGVDLEPLNANVFLADDSIAMLPLRSSLRSIGQVSVTPIPLEVQFALDLDAKGHVEGRDGRMCGIVFGTGCPAASVRVRVAIRPSRRRRKDMRMRILQPAGSAEGSRSHPRLLESQYVLEQLGLAELTAGLPARVIEPMARRLYCTYRSGVVHGSRLFDEAWYSSQLDWRGTDADRTTASLLDHYGQARDRADPHPLVDEHYVLLQAELLGLAHPENAAALDILRACKDFRLNPTRLFCTAEVASALGLSEGSVSVAEVLCAYMYDASAWSVLPHPLFDPGRLTVANQCPLLSYAVDRDLWTESPHPLFDYTYFVRQLGGTRHLTMAPLMQYLRSGLEHQWNPHPMFHTRYYALQNAEAWDGRMAPLEHFVRFGRGDPSPRLQVRYMLASKPELVFDRREQTTTVWTSMIAQDCAFAVPPAQLDRSATRVVVQMTPVNTRNPYFGAMASVFRDAGWDFRNSVNVEEMASYAAQRSDLLLWFHQLEALYGHGSGVATRSAALGLLESMRKMRQHGARLIHTWHNPVPHDRRHLEIDIELYGHLDEVLDCVIVHTPRAEASIRRVCPSARVVTLPHPSYIDRLQSTVAPQVARRLLGVPEESFVVACFGDMKRYKRIDLLLAAWRDFAAGAANRNSLLILAGRWSEEFDLRDRAAGMSNIAVLDEYLSDDKLSLVVAASNACVMPHSEIWMSGSFMVALGFGKTVVVARSSGMADHVLEGQNGVLFDDDDPASLASALSASAVVSRSEHAGVINRGLAEDWHPYRLQPLYAAILRGRDAI